MKAMIFALALLSAPAFAQYECVAIPLFDSEDAACEARNSALQALSAEEWNQQVCVAEEGFSLSGYKFERDLESYNLKSEGTAGNICEWEVRAPSGRD